MKHIKMLPLDGKENQHLSLILGHAARLLKHWEPQEREDAQLPYSGAYECLDIPDDNI